MQAPEVKGCRVQAPSQLGLAQYRAAPPVPEELHWILKEEKGAVAKELGTRLHSPLPTTTRELWLVHSVLACLVKEGGGGGEGRWGERVCEAGRRGERV